MGEKETSFPYEASDAEKKRRFYAESLKAERHAKNDDFLPDDSAEVGEPGDLGGGYNSLADGSLKPSDIDPSLGPDWKLSDATRQIGREGVKNTREALKKPPRIEEDN